MEIMDLCTLKTRTLRDGFVIDVLMKNGEIDAISLSLHEDDGSVEHFFIPDADVGFLQELMETSGEVTCFDMRCLLDVGIDISGTNVVDVSLLFGAERLTALSNSMLSKEEVDEFAIQRRKFQSHIRACKTAKIDVEENSLVDIVPNSVLMSYFRLRNEMTWELRKKASLDTVLRFESVLRPRAEAMVAIERNGIKVNTDVCVNDPADVSFIEGLKSRVDEDGYVYTRFVVDALKTGRIKVARGYFNCMNIPKTPVRRSIVSRFHGGKIASLDMNAADFRCIVVATDDVDLMSLYRDCDDFHARTVETVFCNDDYMDIRRPIVKQVTHLTNYGATFDRLLRATKLAPNMLENLLKKMEFLTKPVDQFRKKLFEESMRLGSVVTPLGTEVKLRGDEHPGKVLALFAQSSCNDVFMDGVISAVSDMSASVLPLFTVHDEFVLDVMSGHENELRDLKRDFESGTSFAFGIPFVAKVTVGRNYWDQEDYL